VEGVITAWAIYSLNGQDLVIGRGHNNNAPRRENPPDVVEYALQNLVIHMLNQPYQNTSIKAQVRQGHLGDREGTQKPRLFLILALYYFNRVT
jgi:deferrochelatase/peroxidase EfeB